MIFLGQTTEFLHGFLAGFHDLLSANPLDFAAKQDKNVPRRHIASRPELDGLGAFSFSNIAPTRCDIFVFFLSSSAEIRSSSS